jgi:uncharacterized protein with PIN domain
MLLSTSVALAQVAEPEPLSAAVAAVLKRADDGIVRAQVPDILASIAQGAMPEVLRDELSTLFTPIDITRSVVQARENLQAQTACARYDLWLIERKMDAVRKLISDETDLWSIFQYQNIYDFLDREHNSLEQTGLLVQKDEQWFRPLNGEEDELDPPSICFYNSDYARPSENGFGCDAEILDRIANGLPEDAGFLQQSIIAELHAQTLAEQATTGIRSAQENFALLSDNIDTLVTGGTPADLPAPVSRIHRMEEGCIEVTDPGIVKRGLRTDSLTPDDVSLTFAFRDVRKALDADRPLPDAFTPKKEGSVFEELPKGEISQLIRAFTEQQTVYESTTFAAAADPALATSHTFGELRSAVAALVKLGNAMDGLRHGICHPT